ncbi:MAG: glycoside hydrolase family 15 protein [Gaiellaceae bacterium]
MPHLPSAIAGNGEVLVTLSARAEVERLFWPHVDWGQHLGELRLGIVSSGETQWLDEFPFEHQQRYLEDAAVVETTAVSAEVKVTITDFVLHDAPVLARSIEAGVDPRRIVVYIRPEIDESSRYGGAYVDGATGHLVFYRRGTAIAVGLNVPSAARTGRLEPGAASPALEDARRGELGRGNVEYGSVDGAVTADFTGCVSCLVAFGRSPAEALSALSAGIASVNSDALGERLAHDRRVVESAREPVIERPGLARLYRRSLLVFETLADRRTGGVIAAPEMDGDFRRSGGYGFVWGRDMAFSILAFLAAGRSDLATRALLWLVKAQSPEGLWLHRHWTDGSLAPSWGLHQIDETGSALFAFEAAWRELEDPLLDAELWPSARAAADFLVAFRDPDTGLTRPSVDLWEERHGRHAYSAAAVCGGLRAAAAIASRHDPERRVVYAAAAAELAGSIESALWDDESASYLRSARGSSSEPEIAALRYPADVAVSASSGAGSGLDRTPDASLLGLSWPFNVVRASSPRMMRTVEALRARLLLPDGGLRRYDGDTYAGGNAWILTTLWLGLWSRQAGDDVAFGRSLDYAIRRRTAVGLLPEQSGPDGTPWVVPLTWSHAMLVLAARPELRLVADFARGVS